MIWGFDSDTRVKKNLPWAVMSEGQYDKMHRRMDSSESRKRMHKLQEEPR